MNRRELFPIAGSRRYAPSNSHWSVTPLGRLRRPVLASSPPITAGKTPAFFGGAAGPLRASCSQYRVLGAKRRRTLIGASPLRGDFVVPYSRPHRPSRLAELDSSSAGRRLRSVRDDAQLAPVMHISSKITSTRAVTLYDEGERAWQKMQIKQKSNVKKAR